MLNRFEASIFKPRLIGAYSRDKLWFVFLYMLIMICIMMIPIAIEVISYDGFTDNEFKSMKNSYISQKEKIPVSSINNYKFYMNEENITTIYLSGYAIGFGEVPNSNVGIYLANDHVSVCLLGVALVDYSYKDLNLENIDFYRLAFYEAKYDTNGALYDDFLKIKQAINIMTNDIKPLWMISYSLAMLIITVCGYLLISLLLTLVVKIGTNLAFKEVYVTVIYSLTVGCLGKLFSQLLSFELLDYIGSFLTIIYLSKAMKILILNRLIENSLKK